MRKVTMLSVLFTVCTVCVWAQCKPAISTVNEFTEQKIEAWGGKLGFSLNMFREPSQNLKFYVGTIDGKMFASISVAYIQKGHDASVNNIDIPKGSKFMLKTDDGLVSFITEKVDKVKKKISSYTVTTVELTSELTDEQLQILAKSPITMYRITPKGAEAIEGKINGKEAKKLQEQFKCFSKNK